MDGFGKGDDMSRIIRADNFDRDTVSENFILWSMRQTSAEKIATILNQDEGPDSPNYFKVVANTYKLYKFEP